MYAGEGSVSVSIVECRQKETAGFYWHDERMGEILLNLFNQFNMSEVMFSFLKVKQGNPYSFLIFLPIKITQIIL